MPSQFGQLLSVINLAEGALYTGAQVAIKDSQTKAETQVAKGQQSLEAQLAAMDATAQEKKLLQDTLNAQRRDQVIKDIALYGGIGLAALVTILVIGILFVKKEEGKKYEYVMEKVQ